MIESPRPLSGLTSLRIGGPAARFEEPTTPGDLHDVLRRTADRDEPVRALGGGKNLLVHDRGVSGTVISFRGLTGVKFRGTVVIAKAGTSLAALVGLTAKQGLSGLEGLVGVPGTVGGAVRMNAGGKYGTIGRCVQWVRGYTTRGRPFRRSGAQCGFEYRNSGLQGFFIEEVGLRLQASSDDLAARMKRIFAEKQSVQPLGSATAGCMFKNPSSGPSAGALLDRVGLKGHRLGGARFSLLHANFVENVGGASFDDVQGLIKEGHRRVREEFGIGLSLEVEVWCGAGEEVVPGAGSTA